MAAIILFFTVNNLITLFIYVFILAEIRHLLKKELRKKLDERIIEENIGKADLDVERYVLNILLYNIIIGIIHLRLKHMIF